MNAIHHIDVSELAKYIFVKNEKQSEIMINITCLKTQKELFFLLFDLFCKGLILMYGKDNRMTLNTLGMDQFEEVKQKLRCAHIQLSLVLYDKDTAELLDLIPNNMTDNHERTIITQSLAKIRAEKENLDLKEYVFHLYMNDILYCINFDILH